MADSVSPDIIELLQNVVKENITKFTISVKHNKKGEGFLGEISFLTLKGKNGEKSYNFVVKKSISNADVRKNFPIGEVFVNEIYFYAEVWNKFREFDLTVPSTNVFDNIPKCFANSIEEFKEVLILENLQIKKFKTFNKSDKFNADHVEFIFRTYGRFHAISFAYQALHPEEFSQVSKELKHLWYKFSKSFEDYFKLMKPILQSSLMPEDQNACEKFNNYVENSAEIFNETLTYDGDYTAVLHGDCWSNNMLFKYDESGKVVDLKLLDFQLSHVGTPVWDLSYSLYSGAGKEIYEDLDYYLRVYHNSFSERITEFGCDADALYPFATLKDDWKKNCKFGFFMGLLIWRGRLTFEDSITDLVDLQNSDHKDHEAASKYDEEAYRKIVRDLIIHMYENDFL